MRISRLELTSSKTSPVILLDPVEPGVNVIAGCNTEERTAVADCMAHLLYGRRSMHTDQPAGAVDIESHLGSFRLRREPQSQGAWRLTIASLGPELATEDTISRILGGCSPQFLSGLYFANGDLPPKTDWLLSESVADKVNRLCGLSEVAPLDRHNQMQLLRRCDELSEQIERLLSARRSKSELLSRRIQELSEERTKWTKNLEQSQAQLHAIDVDRASLSSHERCRELETMVDQYALLAVCPEDSLLLKELNEQIERWRGTLMELEGRESQVRSEIAKIRPTESNGILPIADQRAALAVTERLIGDLQSEIARFARSVTSESCICRDAHPRLQPLVALLDKQVARMVALTFDQERAIRWQELRTEAQHLARSQTELREQLECLQMRREGLSRRGNSRRWSFAEPREPQHSSMEKLETSSKLAQRRHEIVLKLEEAEQKCRDLDRDWHRAVTERTTLLADRLLEQKQAELAELQRNLQSMPHTGEAFGTERPGLRSSDLLAQLTDGRLIELKLIAGGRRATVVDRNARSLAVESLPQSEQHLVALSLTLSIVAGLSARGFRLPLILDDPFSPLDDRQSAILAGVLGDIRGQQVFVFTERRAALEHFRLRGLSIRDLRHRSSSLWQAEVTSAEAVPKPTDYRREVRVPKAPPELKIQGSRPTRKKRSKLRSANAKNGQSQSKKTVATPKSQKFYLELNSAIKAAPAISRRLAKQLFELGIRQVHDLLAADAAKLAAELENEDVSASEVVAWQHQARLCCRIPGLRPLDAAMLVGSGFSTPEDVAAMKPAELQGFILAYANSEEGRELLNEDDPPELQSIENWIRAARQARVLGAA